MNYLERFRVRPGAVVRLKDIGPAFTDHYESHEAATEETEHYQKRLRELQELLYAEQQRSLLICLQAMDTGGKDGTINHVLGVMNPQGCRVARFRQPSAKRPRTTFCGELTGRRPPKARWSSSTALITRTY